MLGFLIIACMRVVQAICNKKASKLVVGKQRFFAFGAFEQLVAAAVGFLCLCKTGFYGWNMETILCSLCTSVFMAICLFADLEAMKGAPLAICTVFSMGGLFVPCVLGIFLFDEPMSALQWLALLLFVVSIYLLGTGTAAGKKLTMKTVIMLILSCLANGFVMLVQKYYAARVENQNAALYSCLMFCFSAVILTCCFLWQVGVQKREPSVDNSKTSAGFPKQLFLYGSALAVALSVINLVVTMLAKTFPSVVLYTLSSFISIAITALVGIVVFKERMTVKNMIGILLGVLSIVLSNMY